DESDSFAAVSYLRKNIVGGTFDPFRLEDVEVKTDGSRAGSRKRASDPESPGKSGELYAANEATKLELGVVDTPLIGAKDLQLLRRSTLQERHVGNGPMRLRGGY
ncbi:hypothetical protein JW848_08705, partial [Candidatus Bipolaricaulota bacterium]|nr:hypothetical protein [Candidatus Bipolaricaulota bacterium]